MIGNIIFLFFIISSNLCANQYIKSFNFNSNSFSHLLLRIPIHNGGKIFSPFLEGIHYRVEKMLRVSFRLLTYSFFAFLILEQQKMNCHKLTPTFLIVGENGSISHYDFQECFVYLCWCDSLVYPTLTQYLQDFQISPQIHCTNLSFDQDPSPKLLVVL